MIFVVSFCPTIINTGRETEVSTMTNSVTNSNSQKIAKKFKSSHKLKKVKNVKSCTHMGMTEFFFYTDFM